MSELFFSIFSFQSGVFKEKTMEMNLNECCVYGCKSSRRNDKNIRFHNVPLNGNLILENSLGVREKVSRRKVWENALRLKNRAKKSMRVCGKHFTLKDYLPSISKRPSLKKTAVPSKNLPSSIPNEPSSSRSLRYRFPELEASRNLSQTEEPFNSISEQSNYTERTEDDENEEVVLTIMEEDKKPTDLELFKIREVYTLADPVSGEDASCISQSVTPPPLAAQSKRKRNLSPSDDTVKPEEELLERTRPDDEFDVYGKYVAHKLRSLKGNQAVFARKLMNDIIFEGELEQLNKEFRVIVPN